MAEEQQKQSRGSERVVTGQVEGRRRGEISLSVSQRNRRELQKGSRADGGERLLSSFQYLPRVGKNTGLSGGLRLVRRVAQFQLEGKLGAGAWGRGAQLGTRAAAHHGASPPWGVSGGEDGGDGDPRAGGQLPYMGRDELLLQAVALCTSA